MISDPEVCPYTNAASSTTHALCSPHNAPTLTESSNGSDLDIFINQDSSVSFSKHEFPGLTDPDMAAFPDYVNNPTFESGMDLFPSKGFTTGHSMGDDFFSFQFQMDDQPSDVMTREFFLE
jgi:regulatory protein SWI5